MTTSTMNWIIVISSIITALSTFGLLALGQTEMKKIIGSYLLTKEKYCDQIKQDLALNERIINNFYVENGLLSPIALKVLKQNGKEIGDDPLVLTKRIVHLLHHLNLFRDAFEHKDHEALKDQWKEYVEIMREFFFTNIQGDDKLLQSFELIIKNERNKRFALFLTKLLNYSKFSLKEAQINDSDSFIKILKQNSQFFTSLREKLSKKTKQMLNENNEKTKDSLIQNLIVDLNKVIDGASIWSFVVIDGHNVIQYQETKSLFERLEEQISHDDAKKETNDFVQANRYLLEDEFEGKIEKNQYIQPTNPTNDSK